MYGETFYGRHTAQHQLQYKGHAQSWIVNSIVFYFILFYSILF